MVTHPILIQRPILTADDQTTAIARSPKPSPPSSPDNLPHPAPGCPGVSVDGAGGSARIPGQSVGCLVLVPRPVGEFTLSAWVDESVIVDGPRHPGGTYTLAAAVVETAARVACGTGCAT
jgi:hypothetical protein